MEMKEYIPTEEKLKYLQMLKTAFKNDIKFAYALHTSLMAKRMRSWGHKALRHLPKDKEVYDWMEGYPCGNYDKLVFATIKIHYPDIYEGLRKGIPVGYVHDFIMDNLYPFTVNM